MEKIIRGNTHIENMFIGSFQYFRIIALATIFGIFQLLYANAYSQNSTGDNRQKVDISGLITDKAGEPVIGATVLVKGAGDGAMTNIDGRFSLRAVSANAVLVVSYIGMKTQEIKVVGRTAINVMLEDQSVEIDEVVVVGYGTQKKANLTGAVSAVRFDDQLSSRPLPSASLALQGKVPGLAISQNSGMAGRNDVEMLVRGMGTVNNSKPLVVVDGMPDVDINRINMDDIENISVLKDASSASVYGSRAANGVILITTKSGKANKSQINASASYTVGKPTYEYDMMSDYPRSLTLLQRDAAVNTLPANQTFKNGTIDQWMALGMIDPLRYPNTDWYDVILRDAETQKYNVSATGGTDNSNYYISLGVLDEKGLLVNNDYTRYNARVNFETKIRPKLTIGTRFAGDWSKMQYALTSNFDGTIAPSEMRYAIAGITPYDPLTGYYGGVMAYGEDPMAFNAYNAYTNQLTQQQRQEANASMYVKWEPLKGLLASMDYALKYYNDFRYQADIPAHSYNFQLNIPGSRAYVPQNAGIQNYTYSGYKTQLTARLNYNVKLWQNYDFNFLGVYSEEFWYDRYQMSGRLDRIHPSLHEIDAALTNEQTTAGYSNTEALKSVIGRVNLVAYQKYLLELNLRSDGSSKFLGGYQFGFFPSASLGWVFSEENFMKSLKGNWFSTGKFRASYGNLGNNSGVGRYEQQETLSASNYMMDASVVKGLVNKKMINRDFSWEKTEVLNMGVDLGFLSNRLTAEVDFYDRLTTGMIRPSEMSIHLTGAYDAPRRNIGNMRNRGVEGNFVWRDKIKDFKYTLNANVSYNSTVLEKWNEYLGQGTTSNGAYVFIDMPYNYVYAYQAIGIAQTWQDVYNSTPQGAQPGDILYKDLNGDGKIDSNDRKAYTDIQRDRPTTNFALNASMEWRGFDLAIMFQGTAGRKSFWLTSDNNPDLMIARQATNWAHWTEPWSLENRNGAWARLGGYNNRNESTFFLDNMAYLRLKNIQLGYNVPKTVLDKVSLTGIRVFLSADNVATVTSFRGLDPEKRNINDGYPLVRTFTCGINIGI